MYLCFLVYKKVFDIVKHQELIDILKGIGVGGKDLRAV